MGKAPDLARTSSLMIIALAVIVCGCSSGKTGQESINVAGGEKAATIRIERWPGNETWVVVSEEGVSAYSKLVSEYDIASVVLHNDGPVKNGRLDIDGDGKDEFLVRYWEGQNGGDCLLVLGKHDGQWSVWADIFCGGFVSIIEDRNGDGKYDIVIPADTRRDFEEEVHYYQNCSFREVAK